MDAYFQQLRRWSTLASRTITELAASGFVAIPGPLSGDRFNDSAIAYDDLMTATCGPDFRVASTTTRMSDLLSFSSAFDQIFLYPPLLEACCQLIGQPFKLSSFVARTLRSDVPAQELHADLPRDSEDAPLLGFILMIDPFRKENGATRFVPGSHLWDDLPSDRVSDMRAKYPGEILGCGNSGTMILFNAAVRHGHTANLSVGVRRSIQGYFVRRDKQSGFDFRHRLPDAVKTRMTPLARYLLAVNGRSS